MKRPSPDDEDAVLALGQRLEKTIRAAGLTLAGETLALDLCGGLWLARHRTLVVSDLHLEKGSAYAARSGQFLPPYDTRETLACLHEVVARLDPARVVALAAGLPQRVVAHGSAGQACARRRRRGRYR